MEKLGGSSGGQQGMSPGRSMWLQFALPEQKELELTVFALKYTAWVKGGQDVMVLPQRDA